MNGTGLCFANTTDTGTRHCNEQQTALLYFHALCRYMGTRACNNVKSVQAYYMTLTPSRRQCGGSTAVVVCRTDQMVVLRTCNQGENPTANIQHNQNHNAQQSTHIHAVADCCTALGNNLPFFSYACMASRHTVRLAPLTDHLGPSGAAAFLQAAAAGCQDPPASRASNADR